jgi:transposase
LSKTLRGYRTAVLNWYDHQISNGPLEGINNKIKLMQRKAYGYRPNFRDEPFKAQ